MTNQMKTLTAYVDQIKGMNEFYACDMAERVCIAFSKENNTCAKSKSIAVEALKAHVTWFALRDTVA